jgi:hypothetical protein
VALEVRNQIQQSRDPFLQKHGWMQDYDSNSIRKTSAITTSIAIGTNSFDFLPGQYVVF